eukprot:m.79644 g.79644  ORF g.79644 m.79644 type:complete len:255 (+) comp12572_c0_seq2:122-886(+)
MAEDKTHSTNAQVAQPKSKQDGSEDQKRVGDEQSSAAPLSMWQRIKNAYKPLDQREGYVDGKVAVVEDDKTLETLKRLTGMSEQQLQAWVHITLYSSIFGFVIGGITNIQPAFRRFMAANQTTKFTSHKHQQWEINNAVLYGFMRKGASWGWKSAIFVGGVDGLAKAVSNKREKVDALNYVVGGGAMGAVFGLTQGVRGMVVGSLVGSVFSASVGLVQMASISLEQKRQALLASTDKNDLESSPIVSEEPSDQN